MSQPRTIPRSRCPGCQAEVLDDETYCDDCQVYCTQCNSDLDPDEVDAEGVCYPCRISELERHRNQEWMRRVGTWVTHDGSRQRMAGWLAQQAAQYKVSDRHFTRWAFTWEMTGESQTLRKLVERLAPAWERARKGIREAPPTTTQQTA